jgi:hypothetical protein
MVILKSPNLIHHLLQNVDNLKEKVGVGHEDQEEVGVGQEDLLHTDQPQ